MLASLRPCSRAWKTPTIRRSRNKLDADYHIAIAVASGNGLFVKLIEDMRTILEEHSLALAKAPHRRSAARVEHTKIYEAIVRRDMDAAAPRWPSISMLRNRASLSLAKP